MNLKKFFDEVRMPLFSNSIPQTAVVAIDDIIATAASYGASEEEVAYMLATTHHEVGRGFVPRRESLNYSVAGLLSTFGRHRISEADAKRLGRKSGESGLPQIRQQAIANIIYGGTWGAANLGNTKPGDGWLFRGGGYPQVTGRANFGKVSKLASIDLVGNPGRITETHVAVLALVVGMLNGIYTGKRLSNYDLPRQFKQARAIINNDVEENGEDIAKKAAMYLRALVAAGYSPRMATREPEPVINPPLDYPVREPAKEPASEPVKTEDIGGKVIATGIVGALVAAVAAASGWITETWCGLFSFFCGG